MNIGLSSFSERIFPKVPATARAMASASSSEARASRRCLYTSLPKRWVRLARWPSSCSLNTSDVRHARFRLCEDTRMRVTPPKTTLLGRPVSSRLRLDGPKGVSRWSCRKSAIKRLLELSGACGTGRSL